MPTVRYFDIECYRNYFLVMALDQNGRVGAVEMFDGQPLDKDKLYRLLEGDFEVHSFNGDNYDVPMLRYALTGASCEQLKAASDEIIEQNLKGWQFSKTHPQGNLQINHVDLMEVAPGRNGLKIYGTRMHCPKLQELPIEPSASISPEQRIEIKRYCYNDLLTTKALSDTLAGAIDLRRTMTEGLRADLDNCAGGHLFDSQDLRSKSDAQIAEAVLKQRIFMSTGAIPRKRPVSMRSFLYEPPGHIRFRTPEMQAVLETVRSAMMVVDEKTGHVQMPKEIEKLNIQIGQSHYKIGIGGLHSQESEVAHFADDEYILRDIDVRSYYPNLMLNMGMYPIATGPHFLHEYRAILEERLAAKDAGEKIKDAALKICLNGTFGKTSSIYSILYNPQMMIATTLTGQLSILMLIEAFETRGIPVISANTDGIVIRCKRAWEPAQRKIVKAWEVVTNLETEETDYRALYSRDVNSYVAVKLDGKAKTKGAFAADSLGKSPQNSICNDAVVAYVTAGTPVEATIRQCTDLRKFITARRVTTGAYKDGEFIGKVVRWYRSSAVDGVILTRDGNKVGRTAKARPVMDLPQTFPSDVDLDWYIKEANELLMDIAAVPRPAWPKLPRRNTKAWKAAEAEGLVEVDEYGKPQWAVHLDEIPDGYKQQRGL